MFRGFNDDPFFREFNEGMRRTHGDMIGGMLGRHGDMFRDMDSMMNNMMCDMQIPSSMDMLEGLGGTENKGIERRSKNRGVSNNPTRSFFPDMGSLARQMDEMARDGNGYSFSSQQVYSYRNDGKGEPQEYQAISSTAQGPGGIKETKKGYKDTSTKTQKMQYGRHIGERATIQERSQVGDRRDEKTDYFGLTEVEAPSFDHEWGEKASGLYRPSFGEAARNKGIDRPAGRSKQRALPSSKKD